MALPPGYDPAGGTFGGPSVRPVISIPRNQTRQPRQARYNPEVSRDYWPTPRRRSLWQRFNDGVTSIGNWFATNQEDIIGWLCVVAMIAIIGTAIAAVIAAWVNEGFWTAVITAIVAAIGGTIAWYAAAFVIGFIMNIVLYGIRFLFWNGWTLLIAIVAALGLLIYNGSGSAYASNSPSAAGSELIEQVVTDPATRTYRCTARTLNIRSYASTSGPIIGTLRKGDLVEVYDTDDGFARVSRNGSWGYISAEYLEPAE
ncbi:MAG: SH3 domain-containing protein [Clostridium sp.]|nr:SH3 domain-containing protein [Clostridium sp.]